MPAPAMRTGLGLTRPAGLGARSGPVRQIPVREHALCESEEREPVAGKRRTPAGLRRSATPEATVATSPPRRAIGISAVISAPAPQQRSHQTHVLRRNATHPRSRSRYGRCQSGRVLIGAATRGTRHRVTPTVRYRLSSSRQPAPTTWLLWWPSRSAVDDPPDTSDQIASLRSASASWLGLEAPCASVVGSWLSLVVHPATALRLQNRRGPSVHLTAWR